MNNSNVGYLNAVIFLRRVWASKIYVWVRISRNIGATFRKIVFIHSPGYGVLNNDKCELRKCLLQRNYSLLGYLYTVIFLRRVWASKIYL